MFYLQRKFNQIKKIIRMTFENNENEVYIKIRNNKSITFRPT